MKFNKKAFDNFEYSTDFLTERDFLTNKGIRYTFVKTNDSGVRTYRYKKTTELFEALAEFYRYR